MTRPPLAPVDADHIDISKVGHKFAPAQSGDEEALERPPWWRRRFWRGLFRFVWFCALVFVIAYLATLLRDGPPSP
jgi:hypothetical protein